MTKQPAVEIMAKWYDYNKLLINLFPTFYNKVKYIDLSKLVNYSIWIGKYCPTITWSDLKYW